MLPGAVSRSLVSTLFLVAVPGVAPPGIAAAQDVPSAAGDLPAGFTATRVAGGLSSPTAMAFAPDGRIFVAEQAGALRVIKSGVLLPAPFATVPTTTLGERGLLGVAFDPHFRANGFVYVYYTARTPTIHNRIVRFQADGDRAMPGSRSPILELDDLSAATNHNGGSIHFGPDGKLYVGVGENANGANAQTLSNLLGKMLRINADGSIPADNPFVGQAVGRNRAIWALGLRNPFTFDIEPGTGRFFINDVGESTWEEIDRGAAGGNYGWPLFEGPETDPRFRAPVFAYRHSQGCAITGGAFYNPSVVTYPREYLRTYFFSDLCSGWIRRFDPATNTVAPFASGVNVPVDLKVGKDGLLYYLSRGSGEVWKVEFSP